MATKIECRIEFYRSKKAIVMQGVVSSTWSVSIIDRRLSVNNKKDFDNLYDALDEFNALADELVVREDRADKVADTIRKFKGE